MMRIKDAEILSGVLSLAFALSAGAGERPLDVAWRRLLTEFRSARTGLIYEHCSDGDATRFLPRPDEIARNEPVVAGWNTGMEDSVLNGCPLLLATMRRGDRASFDRLYPGLMRCATVSGKPGFLARSISPADGTSFYFNSSRDQYTLFVYTMWRVWSSPFATSAMKDEIRRALIDIARYAETCVTPENGFELLRYDGRRGQVAQMWTAHPAAPAVLDCWKIPVVGGLSPHESERLPMICAAAYAITGDPHWRELELRYADAAIRIAGLGLPSGMPGFTLYQMQVSQRLLWECERDAVRKAKYLGLMRQTADVATNCFARVRARLAELGGDLAVPVGDWRTWKRIEKCPGGVLNELPYRAPVRPKRFAEAYECVREAGEQIIVRKLCPGLELIPEEIRAFKTFVTTSGFDRHNSSGLVYPLLAEALLETDGSEAY